MQGDNQPYKLVPMTEVPFQAVLEFTTKQMLTNEPIFKHSRLNEQQFKEIYGSLIHACWLSGCSFACLKQDKIVSVVLATCSSQYFKPFPHYPQIAHIEAIVQKVDSGYQLDNHEKCISVFIVCTDPAHTGKGLCYRLIKQTQRASIEAGYIILTVQCTNSISEHVFKKLGCSQKCRVYYEKFQFQGGYPFKDIQGTESLVLLIKDIKQSS